MMRGDTIVGLMDWAPLVDLPATRWPVYCWPEQDFWATIWEVAITLSVIKRRRRLFYDRTRYRAPESEGLSSMVDDARLMTPFRSLHSCSALEAARNT